MLLDGTDPEDLEEDGGGGMGSICEEGGEGVGGGSNMPNSLSLSVSPLRLVRKAEYLYERQHHDEAYRLARQAYTLDPYDWRGNLVYIAAMVDLKLKNELFYLGKFVYIYIVTGNGMTSVTALVLDCRT